MANRLDDFICSRTVEEYYNYCQDYNYHDIWYDVETSFCEEMGIEPEVYED